MQHQIEIREWDTIPYPNNWSQEIFLVRGPIQFHTLPGLLHSWAALPNSCPSVLRAKQGGSLYHFYEGLWYDLAGDQTHDLPDVLFYNKSYDT